MIWHGGRIEARVGDITQLRVDAIVNAANSALSSGGGVDGAIHRAGGAQILAECRQIRTHDYPDGLPAGQAVVTGAGSLPARFVIHTVGPIWSGGGASEENLLAQAYLNSLKKASELDAARVAFPAISTGVYGYPAEKASLTAWTAISSYLPSHPVPQTVILIFFSQSALDVFAGAIPRPDSDTPAGGI